MDTPDHRRFARHAVRPAIGTPVAPVVALLLSVASPSVSNAQVSLPPVNLGDTSFVDAVAGPGSIIQETVSVYKAPSFRDNAGDRLERPDSLRVVASVTHLAHLSKRKVLGAYVGTEILVPVVHSDLEIGGGIGDSEMGVGDVVIAPLILQWTDRKLLGRPLFVRFNFNVTAPIGQYRPNALVNAGQNSWRVNPYLAFTWMPDKAWEVSGRAHYLWVGKNDDPPPGIAERSIQPGQAVHMNLAVSHAVSPRLRVGLAGYALRQISDDQIDGRKLPGSRERVVGLGPGFTLALGKKASVTLNAYREFMVRNRPQGSRAVIRLSQPF